MSTLKTIEETPTYAISLFFDEQSTEKLTSLIKSVAEITDNFYVVKNNIPPHITLAMFKEKTQPQQSVQTEQNLQKLKDYISKLNLDLKNTFSQNKINLDNLEIFKNKNIFLHSTEFTTENKQNNLIFSINAKLHNNLHTNFTPASNNLYLPQNYFPHCAIATGLTTSQQKTLLQNKEKLNLPITVIPKNISLAIRHPYKIIL